MSRRVAESAVVALVAAVQFVNILDFLMVMPLGPDFARELGIPSSHLGYIGGSYTAAASVSGIACSFFLDKFDRRSALGVAMLGLALGTAAGGIATGMGWLMAARVLAGAFGGPATSLSFSIIADVVPPERRGKAMGTVMGAFAAASVLGVPAGLELARHWGWRAPFFSVAALGALVTLTAVWLLPPLRGHLLAHRELPPFRELLRKPLVRISYAMTAVTMMAGFILIPNISAYVQYNLGYPRARLGLLYLSGGAVSLIVTQLSGRLVDRFGSFRVGTAGTLCLIATVQAGFVFEPPLLPIVGLFMAFMFSMGLRNVSYNTLTSRVPTLHERARFMSLQSAVQHAASAAGAFLSSRMLTELSDHKLVGMPNVAYVSIALSAVLPALLWLVESRVRAAEADRALGSAAA
jgi:predicted MFS family arabinose efflux permease